MRRRLPAAWLRRVAAEPGVAAITGLVWLAALGLAWNLSAGPSDLQAAGKIANFSLRDHEGKTRELYEQTQARAVVLVFTSTGCPIVQKSLPKLKALHQQFGSKGVVFWLVDSNAQDDLASIKEEARDFGIDLPILLDSSQSVARGLDATRTAEAVCIQPKTWTVFYRGAIDDQFGYGSEKRWASHAYLEKALKNFLAGKKVDPARTEVRGCRFHFEPPSRTKPE